MTWQAPTDFSEGNWQYLLEYYDYLVYTKDENIKSYEQLCLQHGFDVQQHYIYSVNNQCDDDFDDFSYDDKDVIDLAEYKKTLEEGGPDIFAYLYTLPEAVVYPKQDIPNKRGFEKEPFDKGALEIYKIMVDGVEVEDYYLPYGMAPPDDDIAGFGGTCSVRESEGEERPSTAIPIAMGEPPGMEAEDVSDFEPQSPTYAPGDAPPVCSISSLFESSPLEVKEVPSSSGLHRVYTNLGQLNDDGVQINAVRLSSSSQLELINSLEQYSSKDVGNKRRLTRDSVLKENQVLVVAEESIQSVVRCFNYTSEPERTVEGYYLLKGSKIVQTHRVRANKMFDRQRPRPRVKKKS